MNAAVGLRVVAAMAAGARPASRRRSPVVHLYVGPASRTGRFATIAGRVLCGVRCLRLPLLDSSFVRLDLGGRRFCRRCTSLLPVSLGRDVRQLVTPEDSVSAYDHLTTDHFRQAVQWARTTDEAHQVSRVVSHVLGPCSPHVHPNASVAVKDRAELERRINTRLARLRTRELSPEERADAIAQREAETEDHARIQANDRRENQIARVRDRKGYRAPWERELIGT